MQRKTLFYIILVILGFYALYFAGLGRNPLLDPDEPIYGQFVKEMVRGGDWLTPHYAGEIWFDKPPMYYWLASIAVKAFGLSEFSIRLPSAICAVGIVLLVFMLASYDFGRRAGIFASVVMATSLMQIIMSHAAATDAIMVFFFTLALYSYRRWLDSAGRSRFVWMAACGGAAGFGMLTKGPVVPFLLSATFLIHLWWTGSLKKLKISDAALGAGVALAIGLPWYVTMIKLHGRVFIDEFIIANNLTRFAQPLHKSQTGSVFSYIRNVPIMLAFFLPWSTFLPQAIVENWRQNTGTKLAIVWFGVVLVFFSISKTQNFTYTYPLFPAAAMLVGALFDKAAQGDKKSVRSVHRGIIFGAAIAILLAAAMVVFAVKRFPSAIVPAYITGSSLLAAFAASIFRWKKSTDSAWITSAGMVIFTLALIYCAMPSIAPYKSSKLLARRISTLPGVYVTAFNLWKPGILYYLDKKPEELKDVSAINSLMTYSKPAVIICTEEDEEYIEKAGSKELFGYGDLDVYANTAYMQQNMMTNKQAAYDSICMRLARCPAEIINPVNSALLLNFLYAILTT